MTQARIGLNALIMLASACFSLNLKQQNEEKAKELMKSSNDDCESEITLTVETWTLNLDAVESELCPH